MKKNILFFILPLFFIGCKPKPRDYYQVDVVYEILTNNDESMVEKHWCDTLNASPGNYPCCAATDCSIKIRGCNDKWFQNTCVIYGVPVKVKDFRYKLIRTTK